MASSPVSRRHALEELRIQTAAELREPCLDHAIDEIVEFTQWHTGMIAPYARNHVCAQLRRPGIAPARGEMIAQQLV